MHSVFELIGTTPPCQLALTVRFDFDRGVWCVPCILPDPLLSLGSIILIIGIGKPDYYVVSISSGKQACDAKEFLVINAKPGQKFGLRSVRGRTEHLMAFREPVECPG